MREEGDCWEHSQDVTLSWGDAPRLALGKAAPWAERHPESWAGPHIHKPTPRPRGLLPSPHGGAPHSQREEVEEDARQEALGLILPVAALPKCPQPAPRHPHVWVGTALWPQPQRGAQATHHHCGF